MTGALLAVIVVLLVVVGNLSRTLHESLDRAEDAIAGWNRSLDREQQQGVILRHMGRALEHACNDDWEAADAVLGEITTR